MVALSHNPYTRGVALEQIDAFLERQLSVDAFGAWVEGYDWDLDAPEGDAVLRDVLALLELALHLEYSHKEDDREVHEILLSARQRLLTP